MSEKEKAKQIIAIGEAAKKLGEALKILHDVKEGANEERSATHDKN